MWKILTLFFLLILMIFGFVIGKDYIQKFTRTSTEKTTGFLKDSPISTDLVGQLSKFTGTIAPAPNSHDTKVQVSPDDLGEISPYSGKIYIDHEESRPDEDGVQHEYLVIRAKDTNTEEISISAWSLQSMITDTHVPILDGVEKLEMNTVNPTTFITLKPGEYAIVSSAESPVGVSFKTNLCTGYLGYKQTFEPELSKDCPPPSSLMQPTLKNIRTYGASCIDFFSNIPPCSYVLSNHEQSLITQIQSDDTVVCSPDNVYYTHIFT